MNYPLEAKWLDIIVTQMLEVKTGLEDEIRN